MRFYLSLLAGIGAAASLAAQDRSSETALAEIRKLGAQVVVDAAQPDAPVAVTLLGSRNPAACLPHLKDVANLRTCDF